MHFKLESLAEMIVAVPTIGDKLYRADSVFRWRFRAPGSHHPFFWPKVSWSFDAETWKQMPGPKLYAVDVSDLRSPGVTEPTRAHLEELLKRDVLAPVCHDLYREAWHQPLSNPRSSLVLAVAAAEVGVKECVGVLVPDAEWLVETLASPPIERMLREYLPRLPAREEFSRGVLPPPEDIL